jgi:peptidoglycan/LPS O-acetylase OafA/YrhL
LRALYALTFTNELWFSSVRLGTNGPYWSLGYEFWFYVLFAAATYLGGARRLIWVALLALVAGPKILLLMPSWLVGVWIWRQLRAGSLGWSRGTALAAAVLPPVLYGAALSAGIPHDLYRLTTVPLGPEAAAALQFSDEFVWNGILGVLVGCHFLGMAELLCSSQGLGPRIEQAIRWPAGLTFTIYLLHYPVLHFLAAALGTDPSAAFDQALLLGSTLMFLALIGAAVEPSRYPLRTRLHALFDRFDAPRAPVPPLPRAAE